MTEHLPPNTSPLPVKLRVEDYLLLDRSGAFDAYAKTELIDGEILYMNAQHRPHGFLKDELAYRLRRALEALNLPLYVATEQSVSIPPHSEPQPDITVTSEPRGPGAIPLSSVALVVEVSDTTLDYDLGAKAHLYAAAGMAEYWVADVNGSLLHQFWSPAITGYRQTAKVQFGNVAIEARTVGGLKVPTDDL